MFLSIIDKEVDPLLLNLLEMWCALTLQTLTLNALREYLPEGAVAPYAGRHLNVALPIHQSDPVNAVKFPHLENMYHSQDPLVRRYYASLCRRFHDLKFSPSALAREYYDHFWQTKAYIRRNNARLTTAKEIQIGKEVYVYETCHKNDHQYTFYINGFFFTLNRTIAHLPPGVTPIHVRCDLTEDKSSHPYVYAQKCLEDDPCRRLGVLVEGNDEYGKPFSGWITSYGVKQVKRMNTFVDWLEGKDMITVSKMLPRRWIKYTSNKDGVDGKPKRYSYFTS